MAEHEEPPTSDDPTAPDDAGARPPALRDPGAMLIGLWFAVAGVLAAALGDAALDDLPPVLVPISFAVVGLGLLLPKRRSRSDTRLP